MLTENRIKSALPKQRPDGSWKPALALDQAGLYIQVSMGKDGVNRSWIYRYTIGSKSRTLGLGSWPTINLAAARDAAAVQRAIRASGRDPLTEKREARADLLAKIAADNAPKPVRMTFGAAAAAYIDTHKAAWKSPKSLAAWQGTLRTHAANLAPTDVANITTADVLEAVAPLWLTKTTTAKNLRSRIELVLDWAMAKGFRREGDNPAAFKRLTHLLPDASKVAKVEHHAALHYTEIASFMADVAAVDSIQAKALRFCILTATRTDETRSARWREIDLETRVWTIPDNRMKAGEEHTIPLSDAAMEILTSLWTEHTEPGDCVFAQPHGLPFCESAMLLLAKKLRPDTKLTVHGFRSCMRDWCGDETDTPREIAEAALAHKISGVEGAYRRGTALQKRHTLMEAWASHCVGGTVIPFNAKAQEAA
jgi:integrase